MHHWNETGAGLLLMLPVVRIQQPAGFNGLLMLLITDWSFWGIPVLSEYALKHSSFVFCLFPYLLIAWLESSWREFIILDNTIVASYIIDDLLYHIA